MIDSSLSIGPAPGSPVVARRRLAAELRRLREQRDALAETVARALRWSPSKLSRYERCRVTPAPREVTKLLDYYEVAGSDRDLLLGFAHDARRAGWWDAYDADLSDTCREIIGLEHDAATILIWQSEIVPELLQTESYARQVAGRSCIELVPPGVARRRAEVTVLRQQILTRGSPPRVRVIIDESVLRRPIRDATAMHDQVLRLAAIHPYATVQVLPLTTYRPVSTGSFNLFRFDRSLPDVVVTDHLAGGCITEEEHETYLYSLAFDALAAAALNPSDSRSLIQHVHSGKTDCQSSHQQHGSEGRTLH